MERVAILAITKNGIKIAKELKEKFSSWEVFAPNKFSDGNTSINWYGDNTSTKIVELFKSNDALVCLFSLGAVVRLISPHLKDKKTDPAVIVIDDKAQFVISTLSGHLGGANKLTNDISDRLGATPVITTAADVNKTIAVDLVGKDFGWKIDDDSNVTKISAFMVNEEKIVYPTINELKNSDSKGYLIITDEVVDDDLLQNSVVYRPPSLVVGVGLHWDTTKETIKDGLMRCMNEFKLSEKSITKLVSIKKEKDVVGLAELAKEISKPIEYFEKEELASISTPNPSKTVQTFEGTASVSEAAAIKASGGELVVEKQKFPPNLTIAIARIQN